MDEPRDPWQPQTRAPGAFLTIRAGGPLDGVVTISAIAGDKGRVLVEARWNHGERVSATLGGRPAQALAHAWADQLAAGLEPATPP